MSESLPLSTRFWFAFVCFFRVLFDGAFAARALAARSEAQALPEPVAEPHEPATDHAPDTGPALQLLALLQREGRLVDFIQQDITTFKDAEVGAAARVVHEGCRRALASHLKVRPIRSEDEGSSIALARGDDADRVKLIGNVGAAKPERGTLRHRGWLAESFELPRVIGAHDPNVLAPAEVEV